MSDEIQIDVLPPSALGTISKAEIDIQVATAKAYPRSIKTFQRDALDLVTLDQQTAESCYYRLPRRQWDADAREYVTKIIEGGSVRLAEIVGVTYGNLRCGARVVDEGERFVTAQGVAFDMQRNFFMTSETKRRITTSKGKRYGDDMVAITANAACSIALRNAIFRVVPLALCKPLIERAKEVAIGKGKSLSELREIAFHTFERKGASKDDVLHVLGRRGIEDVTLDDIVTLRGLLTAIKDGEITLEQALHPEDRGSRRRAPETVEPPSFDTPPPAAGEEDQRPPTEPEDESQAQPESDEEGACELCGGKDWKHTDQLCPNRGVGDEYTNEPEEDEDGEDPEA